MSRRDLTRDELPFLKELVIFNQCKRIVEIGVAAATSTVVLCQAALQTNGHVWGFDIWSRHGLYNQFGCNSKEVAIKTLEEVVPAECFDLVTMNTREEREKFREYLEKNCAPIDFCFIDGCHSYIGVAGDFFTVFDLMAVPGIIVFHDTCCIDGCREFILDLRSKYYNGTFDIVDFPFGLGTRRCGVSLLVKRSYHKIDRHIDEICNLVDRRAEIEAKEREWYISQEELYAKPVHKPNNS